MRGLCRWPTCERPVKVKRQGLCWVHDAQRIKGTLGRTRPYHRRLSCCAESGCSHPVLGRGLCALHYQRAHRIAAGMTPTPSKGRAGEPHWRLRRRGLTPDSTRTGRCGSVWQTPPMITSARWKRAVRPLAPDFATWAFSSGKVCYQVPVGWVLFGVHAEGSGWNRDQVYISTLPMPLFVPSEHLTLSQSVRAHPAKTVGPRDRAEFDGAIIQAFQAIPTEADALADWSQPESGGLEVRAYSCILTGSQPLAESALNIALTNAYDADSPYGWVRQTRARLELVRSALHDGGVPAATEVLAGWRDQTIAALGV